ncbi:MAG TPA: site-2 protease family protein [Ktedonobacterales bacterium]
MRAIRLGRIAGIEIDLDWSWLIILALFTGSLATGQFPQTVPGLSAVAYLGAGLLASLLLFASVIAHELGHSLVARRFGVPVKDITLYIFGGVSSLEREPKTPGAEFLIAVVGPVVSLVLGAVFWLLSLPLRGFSPLSFSILGYLGVANITLGIFNLLPGFPLDGGRVLRAILWKVTGNPQRATRGAARTGQVLALLFILIGVLLFFNGDFFGGIWIGFIGWFLFSAAAAANRQMAIDNTFRGLTVRDLMQPAPASAPANISLQRLVEEYILPLGLRAVPVMQAGRPVGVISLNDLRKVPRDQWEGVPVGYAMTPIDRIHSVAPQQPIADILPLLADGDVGLLPVVENDTLVGILSREAIVHAVDVRRNLGVGGRVVEGSAGTEERPTQSQGPSTNQWPGNAPT